MQDLYIWCVHFTLLFYKIIHPRWVTLLLSNVTILFGTKLEKMFIIVMLKIETCLLTVLLLNKVS